MRFTATSKFNAIAKAAGKYLQWKAYIKKTAVLTDALSAGTWTEITDRIRNIPDIESTIELGLAQFTASSITVTGHDVDWWQTNFWTYANFLEVKIELQIGLSPSDLATDIVYAFSGLVQKNSIHPVEGTNDVSFSISSYDEYSHRRSAEDVVFQPVNTDVDGAGKDGLVLQNIPGLFASDANIASFALKKGIHTVTWEYNGGTKRMKLDDGSFVNLPGVNGTATLVNLAGDQKLEVYVRVTEQLGSGTVTQGIIVTTQGNTIPNVWYQGQWVFTLLKALYTKIGITSFGFDTSFILNTWDGRNITSYFEIPPGDSFYAKPGCITYDGTNNVAWIGVGDKLLKRNMTTHVYTDLGVLSSGYNIVRMFREQVTADKLWVLGKNSSNAYKLFRITISTGSVSSYTLTNRGTGDNTATGCQNFAFGKNYGSGVIYYCATNASDHVWYFDTNTLAEVDTNVILDTTTALQYTLAGWSDGTDYFIQRYGGSFGLVKIVRVYDSGGGWLGLTKLGGATTNEIEDGAYQSNDAKFYYTLVGSNGVYSYNHGADSLSTIDATGSANNFWTRGEQATDRVYFKRGTAAAPTFSYVITGTITNISGTPTLPFTGDYIERPNRIAHWIDAPNGSRIIGVLERSFLLWQFGAASSMYVNVEANFAGKMIGDAVRELALAFILMVFISSIKKAYAYRRGDNSGTPVNSGNILALTIGHPEDMEREQFAEEKFDIVQVSNGTTTYNYNGTNMVAGEYVAFADERVLTIDSAFIPSLIVQDIAYYAYQYFKTNRDSFTFPLALATFFQYEPFDGLSVAFTTTNIKKTATGTITGQTLKQDGSMVLRTLLPTA